MPEEESQNSDLARHLGCADLYTRTIAIRNVGGGISETLLGDIHTDMHTLLRRKSSRLDDPRASPANQPNCVERMQAAVPKARNMNKCINDGRGWFGAAFMAKSPGTARGIMTDSVLPGANKYFHLFEYVSDENMSQLMLHCK